MRVLRGFRIATKSHYSLTLFSLLGMGDEATSNTVLVPVLYALPKQRYVRAHIERYTIGIITLELRMKACKPIYFTSTVHNLPMHEYVATCQ